MTAFETRQQLERVSGYQVRLDLSYDPLSRTWLEFRRGGLVRVGIDPLEVEASGTVAALSLAPAGTQLGRGDEMGSLEAEKFVGPLRSPLSGTIEAVNDMVLSRPSEVDRDPYGAWLLEIRPDSVASEAALLVTGPSEVRSWFEAQVREYRLKGVLAE